MREVGEAIAPPLDFREDRGELVSTLVPARLVCDRSVLVVDRVSVNVDFADEQPRVNPQLIDDAGLPAGRRIRAKIAFRTVGLMLDPRSAGSRSRRRNVLVANRGVLACRRVPVLRIGGPVGRARELSCGPLEEGRIVVIDRIAELWICGEAAR